LQLWSFVFSLGKQDADGQASGVHEFTRKILLENLSPEFDGVIDPSPSATIIRNWNVQ
jgi:hypothetical protein